MIGSDARVTKRKLASRLGEHFVDLHNAVQNFKKAPTQHQKKLLMSIKFHLEQIYKHKHDAEIMKCEKKRGLLLEASGIVIGDSKLDLILQIKEFNRRVATPGFRDHSLIDGVLGSRALLLMRLPDKAALGSFPWLY
jgi:hypothetical protein